MKRMFGFLMLLTALLPSMAGAEVAYIDNAGRTWRQVSDTLGFTWFDVLTVCDVDSGSCAGSLSGVDFNGWQWANVATVNDLFNEFSGGSGFNTADPQEYEIPNSTWAPQLIDNDGVGPDTGVFNMTALFSGVDENVLGWTRDKDPDPATGAYLGRIVNTPTFDKLQTDDRSDIDQENPAIVGFWLYQPATMVPVPGAVWLLAGGLAVVASRRRQSAAAGEQSRS